MLTKNWLLTVHRPELQEHDKYLCEQIQPAQFLTTYKLKQVNYQDCSKIAKSKLSVHFTKNIGEVME